VLCTLLAAAGCRYTISERHLFHPQRFPVLADTVKRTNVEVTAADGTVLRGWHLGTPGSRLTLLYFYGNGESVLASAPVLYRLAALHDADVFAVDYRGYGFSDGTPELEKIAADALLVYDRCAGEGKPVVVFGRSLGSVFALRVAVERRPAALVLQAPPTTLADVVAAWERNVPWYVRPFVFLRPDARLRDLHPQPVEDAARLAVPLLVIHGSDDRTIPEAQGREIERRAASAVKRLCLVEGAGHNDLDVLRGPAAVCLGRFLAEVLPR
jgi:pimeloyl-ACP methyl ester carboxylesterase